MDRVDAATRSRTMSRIRKRWSQIDRIAHNVLKASRVQHVMYPKLPGAPDLLVYPDILMFLDGCFWHCCPKCFRPPKSRIDYWVPKLAGNKQRDRKVSRLLRAQGWKVVRIWEHDVRAGPGALLQRLHKFGMGVHADLVGPHDLTKAIAKGSPGRQSRSRRSQKPRRRQRPKVGT